jgi:signal transduction histidine kinase
VLRTSYSKSDILPKKLLLISILANLAFSAIANTHLCSKVERMSEEIVVLGDEISDLSKIAVVGEMSDNFFHTMKNRIQVMISSIELLNKNVRTEEVMKILKEEVDRTAKALKSISDFSRGMIAKYDYGYYNVNLLITSTVDVLETTLSKAKLNITIKENPKHPHIYGSANSITQMLLFLLNELRKQLSVGSSIQIESAEQSERINIKITVKDENSPGKDFYSSFIEGENVKFAAAKRLIEQNRGAFTSAVEANNRIVYSITIPKRARGLKTITSN